MVLDLADSPVVLNSRGKVREQTIADGNACELMGRRRQAPQPRSSTPWAVAAIGASSTFTGQQWVRAVASAGDHQNAGSYESSTTRL
jgi:hypothetical protein